MDIQEKMISKLQLLFLIAGYVQGSVFLLSFIDGVAGTDSWLTEIFSYFVSLPFIFSYFYLMKRFPGKNLIEVNEIVFGKWIGRIVSIFYALYFFLLFQMNLYVISDFYTTYLLQDTPRAVIIIIFAMVCAYCVKFGISDMAKLSHFAVFFIAAVVGLIFILLLGQMDFTNFIPFFKKPPEKLLQGVHIFTAVPLCDTVVFLLIFPSLQTYHKAGRKVFWGVTLGFITLFVATIRNIAVLGDTLFINVDSSYRVFRMINIGGFLNRVELLIVINITLALFVKVCVIFFSTLKATGQILNVRSTNTLLLPLAALAIVMALVAFPSSIYNFDYLTKYHVFFVIPCELVFPPLTLFIAVLRKQKGKESAQAQNTSAG